MSKFFLCFLLPISCFATLNGNGDFQIWERLFWFKHFNPKWQCKLDEEARWGDSASFLYDIHLQIQIIYTPFSWARFSPGYRQVWKRTNVTAWTPVYIPFFDFTWGVKGGGFEIKDRSRIEYTIHDSGVLPWMYSNRFRIVSPPLFQGKRGRLALFVENHFFWRQGQGVNEDRVSSGLLALLQDNVGGQFFYTERFLKREMDWIHNHVIQVSLLFSF